MPVKKDASGHRSVQAEVEVPGTPEEVWEAIATGPGISSWFVPTEVEQREGGIITANFGPGMDFGFDHNGLGSAAPVHRRQPGTGSGRRTGGNRVDGRDPLRRRLRRARGSPLVREQR